MTQTVVVTGGAGFIGHHLVNFLSKTKRVVVLENFARGEAERLNSSSKNVILKRCDIQQYTEVQKALEDFTISEFYHLAAINGTDNFYKFPVEIMNVGVLGCVNILRYMAENRIQTGVFFLLE